MPTDELLIERDGPVLRVTFNRPAQRNAMTWGMYDGLVEACERADADDDVRVMVLTGAGEKAFVAGTDIAQFAAFESGADGVAYEERVGRIMARLAEVSVPTVAAVQGFCVGAGIAIAATCDLRVATTGSRFGVPVARTLGNCLAAGTTALLVHQLGPSRTMDLLLRARMLDAEEAHRAGFLHELCAPESLQATVDDVVATLLSHAPLTMWASKTVVRRILGTAGVEDDDVVRRVYGSEDFRAGVRSFTTKTSATWTGR